MANEHQTPRTRQKRAHKAPAQNTRARNIREQPARARVGRRVRSDAPWIAILCLTSAFQFFRGAPADGAVFLGAAVVLTLDVLGLLRFTRSWRSPRTVVAYSVGVILVALLTFLPRYSFADGVIVAGVGLTLIPFAWPNPAADASAEQSRERSQSRAIRWAAILWSALGLALCAWEVSSFFLGMPSADAVYAHPALSDLIGPPLDNPLFRAAGIAVWLIGGAALMRRGHTR
ncbi:MAG TPA: hypothetical protein VIJ18_00090 [Microbacteriaceae bacterium]